MRIKLVLIIGIVVIGFTFFTERVHAVCGQNSDILVLYKNGSRVYDSNVLVLDDINQSFSSRKFGSVCINGICHIYPYKSYKEKYLVTVTDKKFTEAINKMADDFIATSSEWDKRFPGDLNYSTERYIVFRLPDLPELQTIAEQAERHPFPPLEDVPNNFTYEHCGYTRFIYYDIEQEKIIHHYEKGQVDEDTEYKDLFEGTKFASNNRFKESENVESTVAFHRSYIIGVLTALVIPIMIIIYFVRRKNQLI